MVNDFVLCLSLIYFYIYFEIDPFFYVMPVSDHPVSIIVRVIFSASCGFEMFNLLAVGFLVCATYTRAIGRMVDKIGNIDKWDKLVSNYRTLYLTIQIITPFTSMLVIGAMLLSLVVVYLFMYICFCLNKKFPASRNMLDCVYVNTYIVWLNEMICKCTFMY